MKWWTVDGGRWTVSRRLHRPPSTIHRPPRRFIMEPCKKVIGCDFELANSLERTGRGDGDVGEAAKMLLDEIGGYPRQRGWGGSFLEWGRRFLEGNGGSAYIDSDHLEINL